MSTRKLFIVRPKYCLRAMVKVGGIAHLCFRTAMLEADSYEEPTIFHKYVDEGSIFEVNTKSVFPGQKALLLMGVSRGIIRHWYRMSREEVTLERVNSNLRGEDEEACWIIGKSRPLDITFVSSSLPAVRRIIRSTGGPYIAVRDEVDAE